MMMVSRLARDERVLTGGEVESLDDPELHQQLERPEDRSPVDAKPSLTRLVQKPFRGEMAGLSCDELRETPAG